MGRRALVETAAIAEHESLSDLLNQTATGDRQAFSQLYQSTAGRILAVVLRLVGNRTVAEEILQEAYLAIWRKADQYRPERGTALTWMMTIARNKAIDRLRADGSGTRLIDSFDDKTAEQINSMAETTALPTHVSGTIRQCVEALQENYRKALLLAYYYGLSHDELASALKSPLGTVKSWVRRGLLQLRECVDQ
jgi:RNA polymerase sigma-70 factor (ECF subfamily)